MRITVVIPAKNAERTLPLLLDALLPQMAPDDEVFVIDDGSNDRTATIAQDRGATVFDTGDGGKGPATARNLGAYRGSGEVILFLDADVIPVDGLVDHVRKRFSNDPNLMALSGLYHPEPANDRFFHHLKAAQVQVWFAKAKRFESFETACAAIRKTAFEKAGGFDTAYTGADVEDYEFGYSLGAPIELDREMMVRHHFPDFAQNTRNYFHRSRQWAKLFLKRQRFDSVATTGGDTAMAVTAPLSIAMVWFGKAGRIELCVVLGYLLLVLWGVSKLPVVRRLVPKFGYLRSALAWPLLWIGDSMAILGAATGVLEAIADRIETMLRRR